jgi:HlyD family secretion protein
MKSVNPREQAYREQVYRQQALDRLNSPDQLDAPMIVPRSAAAIALAGIVLLVATLVAWGVLAP